MRVAEQDLLEDAKRLAASNSSQFQSNEMRLRSVTIRRRDDNCAALQRWVNAKIKTKQRHRHHHMESMTRQENWWRECDGDAMGRSNLVLCVGQFKIIYQTINGNLWDDSCHNSGLTWNEEKLMWTSPVQHFTSEIAVEKKFNAISTAHNSVNRLILYLFLKSEIYCLFPTPHRNGRNYSMNQMIFSFAGGRNFCTRNKFLNNRAQNLFFMYIDFRL